MIIFQLRLSVPAVCLSRKITMVTAQVFDLASQLDEKSADYNKEEAENSHGQVNTHVQCEVLGPPEAL